MTIFYEVIWANKTYFNHNVVSETFQISKLKKKKQKIPQKTANYMQNKLLM